MPIALLPQAAPLLTAAAEVGRLAARSVELTDRRRRLPAEVAQELSAAGFARHFVPARWGGTAGSFGELAEAVALLGEECASTAWCAALYAAHARLAAYLPEQGQQELWGDSPDVRIAAAVVPAAGQAVAVDGGWRLSGTWSYASGVDHADWVLLASATAGAHGAETRVFAVPTARVTVVDTWRSLGLRGTGSNSVVLDDLPVPAHRTFTLGELAVAAEGAARCHAVPYQLVALLQFTAPVLGAARGALRAWAEGPAGRRRNGRPVRELGSAQDLLARTSGRIHAAGLLVDHAARRADRSVPAPLTVAENLRDLSLAAELCADAVGELFRSAGAGAQREDCPLQRRWRDVTAAAGHAALDPSTAAAAYAGAYFPPADGA